MPRQIQAPNRNVGPVVLRRPHKAFPVEGVGVAPTCYRDLVMADDPIGYWRLGEGAGTVVLDAVGSNPGSYVNGPALGATGAITADPDTAVTFTAASSQYVSIPASAALDQVDGPLSWELWIQKTSGGSTTTMELMQKGNFGPNLQLFAPGASHYIEWYELGGAQAVHSAVFITDTAWHHVVGTKDASDNWLIYVDGHDVTVVEVLGTSTFSTAGQNLEFGRRFDNSRYFDGKLDEVAVYSYVLSPQQIASHYGAIALPCGWDESRWSSAVYDETDDLAET